MTDTENKPAPGREEKAGYDTSDVNVTKALVVGVLLTLLVIAFAVVLNEYFIAVTEEISYEQQRAPESKALRELRAREVEQLESYGVQDGAAGSYRIPIERAMELQAQEAFTAKAR
ncbi:MAG TPA: hypothetical protein PLR32_07565 [candidate division Zixibacteria bacterium]|nr:hypothetical protein [candidate division Zixibacteria bacterium]MDD4917572.1 hypothetical protein [candidate division Zixibacteria bacterium]MDM7971495.1 hypothetical protein [candidate division Zixibacteria bacterium]HOD65998.1 hypothetical protein [candidate division Zixibacteria bacterium]HOZ07029.1 hypothetical protein [candidate division Zixibacteria bacterium]